MNLAELQREIRDAGFSDVDVAAFILDDPRIPEEMQREIIRIAVARLRLSQNAKAPDPKAEG